MANVAERARTVLLVSAILFGSRGAAADATGVAEALFQEGRRLMNEGDYHAACAKLGESYRLDPAGGTLMNLAACHEREGKTATAWSEFKDALAQAIRDKRNDRIEEATKRIAALEPNLPGFRILVPQERAAGLEVRLDGMRLGAASWGVRIPVDPGEHVVGARAPGHAVWTGHATAKAGATEEIRVPPLAPEKGAKPLSPSPAPEGAREQPSAARPPFAGYVLAGVGVAAVGVGSYFGLVARAKKKDSEGECNASTCTPEGARLLEDANRAAWFSDAGFAVGLGSLAVATYLFVATPSERPEKRSLRLGPAVGARSLGLDASGTW